jgi:hypothetical protein
MVERSNTATRARSLEAMGQPDFKTSRISAATAARLFGVPSVRAAMDLFGRELLAVDGTWIKAVNNKDRNFTRASLAESPT